MQYSLHVCTQLGVADDDVVKVLELLHGNLSEALHEQEEEERCHTEEPASDSVFDEEKEEEEEEEVEEGEEGEEEQDGEVDERTEFDESEEGTSNPDVTYTNTHTCTHTHHTVTVGPCCSVVCYVRKSPTPACSMLQIGPKLCNTSHLRHCGLHLPYQMGRKCPK